MSRALRSGAPRLYGRHDGARGRAFHVQFKALEARYGPFDPLTRQYAAGAAVQWAEFQASSRDLQAAELARATGRGRRPSAALIARLKRRQGLAWGSYDQAVRRVEELAVRTKRPGDALRRLHAMVAAQAAPGSTPRAGSVPAVAQVPAVAAGGRQ